MTDPSIADRAAQVAREEGKTIREMLTKPGKAAREFLKTLRSPGEMKQVEDAAEMSR